MAFNTRVAVANEAFTAADGTAAESLTAGTARWSLVESAGGSGYLGVTSNKLNLLFGQSTPATVMETGTYGAGQYASFGSIAGCASGFSGFFGVNCLLSGSGGTLNGYEWEAFIDGGAGPFSTVLNKIVNGSRTALDTRNIAWADGANGPSMEWIAGTLYCYQGTSLVFSKADATYSTGKPGYNHRSGSAHIFTLDNFESGTASISAAVPINPYFPVMQLGPLLAQ